MRAPGSRLPTPSDVLYRWHTNALAQVAMQMPVEVNPTPECGWFTTRLVKGGIRVPARIWLDQPTDENGELVADETLRCEVIGRSADPHDRWLWLAANPISEADYNFLMATVDWTCANAPDEPFANPRQPVDWLSVPTPEF